MTLRRRPSIDERRSDDHRHAGSLLLALIPAGVVYEGLSVLSGGAILGGLVLGALAALQPAG